MYNKY